MLVVGIKMGIKIPCLEKQSMITRMAVNSEDAGSCSMKFMDIKFQGFSGTESFLSSL